MNPLESARRVLDASKKSSERPWHIGHVSEDDQFGLVDIDSADGCNVGLINFRHDQGFILAASNHAPEIAQALIDAVEVLELIAGPVEFYDETGQRNMQAAAGHMLAKLKGNV